MTSAKTTTTTITDAPGGGFITTWTSRDPTTRPGAGLRTVPIRLGVVASAMPAAPGRQVADPLVGLVLTLVILRITWQTWRSVRASPDSSTLIE